MKSEDKMKNMEINQNQIQIEAENIGGLAGKTRLEIKSGINIIEAPNAAGKTSIVGAFALSVLPQKEASQHAHILHSAEARGRVKLSFDDQTIERAIQRKGKGKDVEIVGGSIASGDELGLIRQYAVADEHNPVLVKVRAGDNLKEVLTEYSGVEELRAEQKKLLGEKSELHEKLKQGQEKIRKIDALKKYLKDKEKRLEELESEKKKIHEKKPSEEEAKLVELEGEIARDETDLKSIAESIKMAESLIKSRKERLKAIEQRAVGGIEDTVKEIKGKEDEIKALEKDKLELERKYSLKSSELAHLRFIMSSALAYSVPSEDKLAGLISDEDEEQLIICPVCDHKTKYGQIKAKQQKTDEEVKEISKQKSGLEEKINKLNRKINELNAKKTEKESIETEKRRILHELAGHEKLHSKKKEDIKILEARLNELTALKERLLKKRKEVASESEKERIELEREIAVVSSGIDRIQKELKLLESVAADLNKTENKYENIEQRIKELTSEIEERENGIVKIFNTEISKIYEKMGFKKVDELKLDKKFDLNVVRKSKAGAGYADMHSVKSLSKTEREVAGLILLLSGYRAFKVAEKYPLFIIDEISFMDPERLKEFINHIKETAQTIILTTIPGREIDLPGVTHIPLSEVRS